MKQVKFIYSDGKCTLHNTLGVSLKTILKLIGDTIAFSEVIYNSKTRKIEEVETESKVVRAEFIY